MDRRKKRRLLVLDGILILLLIIGVFLFQRLVDAKEKMQQPKRHWTKNTRAGSFIMGINTR